MQCKSPFLKAWVTLVFPHQVEGCSRAWSMVLERLYPVARPALTPQAVRCMLPVVHMYSIDGLQVDHA